MDLHLEGLTAIVCGASAGIGNKSDLNRDRKAIVAPVANGSPRSRS